VYKNILVPMALDHGISAQTLKIAQTLAGETGTITALHVYEAPQGSVAAFLDAETVKEGQALAAEQMKAKTASLDNVKAEIVSGHTYRSIIDYSVKNDISCIVIGSHKPGLSDFLLGSTAARVVRHAPCAVHVYRSSS
jgi:nucleotide-binding universal stress UspA family protein